GGRSRARISGEAPPEAPAVFRPSDDSPSEDLFERLRRLRKRIADERNVPAYVVFSDATLLEMAAKKPRTAAELLQISGVGPKKMTSYGAAFLALLESV